MATTEPSCRDKTYKKLKLLFRDLQTTLDPRLEATSLSEFGIDCTKVNLYHETEEGGAYFLPMSAARVRRFDLLPDFNVEWDPWCPRFRMPNAYWLNHWLIDQLIHSKGESRWSALDTTRWRFSGYKQEPLPNSKHGIADRAFCSEFTSYEKILHEYFCPGYNTDPCVQMDWMLRQRFETPNLPHRICFSLHEIENVSGLLRSEMMTVVGMMIAKMRRKQFKKAEVTPVRHHSCVHPNFS